MNYQLEYVEDEDLIEEENNEEELTPEEEWEEEIKFWGYRSRWPGRL